MQPSVAPYRLPLLQQRNTSTPADDVAAPNLDDAVLPHQLSTAEWLEEGLLSAGIEEAKAAVLCTDRGLVSATVHCSCFLWAPSTTCGLLSPL